MMYGNYGLTQPLSATVTYSVFGEPRHGSISAGEFLAAGMMFGVNPWIVKQFRPQDDYLKRLLISFVADILAGSLVNR